VQAEEWLSSHPNAKAVVDKLLEKPVMFVTPETLDELAAEADKIPEPIEVSRALSFHPAAKDFEPRFRIIDSKDVSGKSRCTGTLDDFVAHFRDRFERERKMLKARVTANPIVTTKTLKGSINSTVRLVAMVTEKRPTKKGNLLIFAEDEEGTTKIVVPSNEKCFEQSKSLIPDDIVAFDGKVTTDFLIANAITWPDMPVMREQKTSERDVAVMYLSDTHVGSKNFLEKEFSHLLSWLNGREGREDLAGKVKYIEIAGDVVDGIGIYPSQEKELSIKDIYKQYQTFCELISQLPDYITVIVSPGNHDAVRRAEPQPCIPEDLIKQNNIRSIGSPSYVDIEGLRHLVYHGTSLDSVISNVGGLNDGYMKPEKPMLEILKRRHLSPVYGDNLIVPEKRDYMVIDDEPDVVHMGHVHRNAQMLYRGTTLINSGTFQSRTSYQIKLGHVPTPCLVPVMELATGKISHLDFSGGVATQK
jgi:DNA polymerase II small subunit